MPRTMQRAPGVYVEEKDGGARPIQAVGTSTAGFVGQAPDPRAFLGEAREIGSWPEFIAAFAPEGTATTHLAAAVHGFFLNGGQRCFVVNHPDGEPLAGSGRQRRGLAVLEHEDEVAIVAAPGRSDPASWRALLDHCESLADRVAILDPPPGDLDVGDLTTVAEADATPEPAAPDPAAPPGRPAPPPPPPSGAARPPVSSRGFGAYYYPWILVQDPLADEERRTFVPPSGHVAGLWARTDALRGVHKAPANEPLRGALNLAARVTRQEQAVLNDAGVNCIRSFPREGIRVWGARTLAEGSSEWRYLSVRRLFSMVEESIVESTSWIVFEVNDRSLWRSIRRDITAFLTRLWQDGALMGRTPEEAFFVQCDEQTNTPEVVEAGQVLTLIGLAPVRPAEFVLFEIRQQAGGAAGATGG